MCRSFVPLAYARDPGLFNAVLNVFFDPLTAKRRSLIKDAKKPKKNVQTAGKMVLKHEMGGAVGWGVGGMHVTHPDSLSTRQMRSAR